MEKVLWGTKKDFPECMEEILCTKEEMFEYVIIQAKKDGYDRLRIAQYDLNEAEFH